MFHDGVTQRQGADTISVETYSTFDGLGAVVSSDTTSYRNGANYQASHTATDYAWYDGAVQSAVRYTPNTSQGTVYTTSYAYSGTGVLTGATINDGRPRSISVRSDALGQVLRRDEADTNYAQADPHDLWYRFDGRQIGHVGNDGRYEQGYAESLADRTHVQFGGTGAFRYGSTLGIGTAEFGERLTPIDTYAQGSAGGGSYTVRAGDSLAGIATHLWGDASLWYKLAQANGLSGDAGLVAGRALTIPAGVMRNTFDAGTLKPYDPSDAYGDTSPTTPKPQAAANRNKCGVFGQILLVVIAVAVTVWASPAALGSMSLLQGALAGAGSLASQGFGVATGIQDKFSWKGVALSALAGGISAGIGGGGIFGDKGLAGSLGVGSKVLQAGINGAVGSALTQGVGVVTGLQSRFDFAGVAAAGIGAGVGQALGRDFARLGKFGGRLAANTAGGLVNAATRSLANGSDFGDNIMAALPDIIGNTIGNLVADGVGTAVAKHRLAKQEAQIKSQVSETFQNSGLSQEQRADPRYSQFIRMNLAAGKSVDEIGLNLSDLAQLSRIALMEYVQIPGTNTYALAIPTGNSVDLAEVPASVASYGIADGAQRYHRTVTAADFESLDGNKYNVNIADELNAAIYRGARAVSYQSAS